MIPARVSSWFRAWFARDAEQRIRRTFGQVRIRGLEHLRTALARGPVLVVSNHTSFWDPLCVLFLTRRVLRAEARAMMDAKNLMRLPFFALVGAFGVHKGEPRDALSAIRYAVRALERPNDLVWIFPQGKEVPITQSLAFEGGASHVERLAKRASVIAIALRYEFGAGPMPSVWVSIGSPRPSGRDANDNLRQEEGAVAIELAHIERALTTPDASFETLIRARESFAIALGSRVLSWFARRSLQAHVDPSVRR